MNMQKSQNRISRFLVQLNLGSYISAIVAAAVLSCIIYLFTMYLQVRRIGFPLDDAWIHLTYARNVATYGEFSFTPGKISSGSTAPLWDFLLVPGFLLPIDDKLWAFALGALALSATSVLAAQLASLLFPCHRRIPLFVGLAVALEWHLVWAAVSGMETVFFTALSAGLFVAYYRRWSAGWIGLLSGLLSVTRPEGFVLAGLIIMDAVARKVRQIFSEPPRVGSLLSSSLWFCTAFILPVLPYLAFNLSTAGQLLPNTFQAKQNALAQLFEVPWWQRFYILSLVPFDGGQLVLLPGVLVAIWLILWRRITNLWLPIAWCLLIPLLYSLELPVVYQEGRYEIPAIPYVMIFGLWGTHQLLALPRGTVLPRVLTRTAGLTIGILLCIFWVKGIGVYARDVADVECRLKDSVVWFEKNTADGEALAIESVGVMGYWTRRPYLDLGGLTTPEVIPYLHPESRIMELMKMRGVHYLFVGGNWYPELMQAGRFHSVYLQHCSAANSPGDADATIYRVDSYSLN